MDERIRSILNDEPLIANREKWFSEMNDLFYGDRKSALHLAGMGGDAAHPELMYSDPEAWLEEALGSRGLWYAVGSGGQTVDGRR